MASTAQIVDLVRAGLATAHSQRVVAGSRKFEVTQVRVTEEEAADAGKDALHMNDAGLRRNNRCRARQLR